MNLIVLLTVQSVLILGLDLFLDYRLGLWLLYFLPLLGTARTPSSRTTLAFGIVLPILMLAGGLFKLQQAPWQELLVPRLLAVYSMALVAVLIFRGKEFGVRAMNAVSEAALQSDPVSEESVLRRDVELGCQGLTRLARQLMTAHEVGDLEAIGRLAAEIEKLVELLGERVAPAPLQ